MQKHNLALKKLAAVIVFASSSFSLFAQTDFAFELSNPTTSELTVKIGDEIPVEIAFNAEAVNEIGAYIATVVDGKMVGFSAATTMESPFSDSIPAKHLGEGKHTVEYMLLPSGSQDQSEALAKATIQLRIESMSLNSNVDMEGFIQNIVKTIRRNDITTFQSFCLSSKGVNKIIDSIEDDTPKGTGVKTELSSIETEVLAKKMIANFEKLQHAFSEKEADISSVRLQIIIEQDINLEMAGFTAMDVRYVISSAGTTFIINMEVILTMEMAYLFDFEFEAGL